MQAYNKAEKARLLKKSKQTKTKQRQEKLARRNPARIEGQIAQLKGLQESGEIRPHERKTLSELEDELVKVRKAREVLGVREEQDHRGGGSRRPEGRRSELGSRTTTTTTATTTRPGPGPSGAGRGSEKKSGGGGGGGVDSDSGESTASSVRDIPMPSGTPPPPPPPRKIYQQQQQRAPHSLPPRPPSPVAITTYEAKPVVRDLKKEAAVFVPAAVQKRAIVRAALAAPAAPALSEGADGGESKVQETLAAASAAAAAPAATRLLLGMVNAAPNVEGRPRVQAEVDEEYERFRMEMEMEMEHE